MWRVIGWQPTPPSPAFRDPLTLRDSAADGPYCVTGLRCYEIVANPAGEDIPGRVYSLLLSPQAIREACWAEGSPLVVHDRAEHQARLDYVADLEDKLEEANAALEAAREENDQWRQRAASPVDEEALTNNIVALLDGRYQRKSGRKPGPKAA